MLGLKPKNRANNSHAGGTTEVNQIVWKEAQSDGGGHDHKGNRAQPGEGDGHHVRKDCSIGGAAGWPKT